MPQLSLSSSRLRELRYEAGWPQDQAAVRAGLSTAQLRKLEAGSVNVTLNTLTKLGSVYGVDPRRELLEWQ
jgi:transcriptional regulator with XRE-family HTH domain